MRAPSPPPAPPTPDPYAVARAQAAANISVAIANTYLTNADEERPDGSVSYDYARSRDVEDPQYKDGVLIGTTIRTIPLPLKKTRLSVLGQNAFDKQQQIAVKMNDAGLKQANQLDIVFASRLTADGLPARPSVPVVPDISTDTPTARQMVRDIGATDLTGHLGQVRDAINTRLEYQIALTRQAKVETLALQGIFPGSVAYDRALAEFSFESNDARIKAFLEAQGEQNRIVALEAQIAGFHNETVAAEFRMATMVFDVQQQARMKRYEFGVEVARFVNTMRQQELQERIVLRTTTVNELSSLMHGGQVSMPQFQNYQSGKISDTPVGEYVYRSASLDMQKYQVQMDAWKMKVGQQQQMLGGILGLGGNLLSAGFGMSDRRLKTDIEQIGTDARGIAWYLFRYIWDAPDRKRHVGVMAQEVPWASVELPGGWLAVNYGAL